MARGVVEIQFTRLGIDPEQIVDLPASVAVGGIRCDEWFARWQAAKKARRSRVRVNNKRGGAEGTAQLLIDSAGLVSQAAFATL